MDLLGQLNVVLFVPEDIDLVFGPPSLRRRYLDAMLCQIDPPYCRALSRYNQVVTQRNALLRTLRDRGGDPTQLVFWDERLVEHGTYLVTRRQEALLALDELAHTVHAELTERVEGLRLRYVPSLEIKGPESPGGLGTAFQRQLQALRQREIAAGVTLLGPHRDEVRFLINDADAGIYGSRGQQRTAALALKLAEVELMRREAGEHPILLLDDVLSELDAHRRRFLLHRLASPNGSQQAIITTTDLHSLPNTFLSSCQLWRVEMGRLLPPKPSAAAIGGALS
jgi:DNA replication and repair protein RecF